MFHRFKKFAALFLLLGILNITAAQKIRPIVLVHGITSVPEDMDPTIKYIRKHIGDDVYVKSVQVGAGKSSSFKNMKKQGTWMWEEIINDPNLQDGFNIIAHSQGGLVARYYIEHYNNPRVYTYISWGTPQCGVFGTPGTLDDHFTWLNKMETLSYKLIYSYPFQHLVSFAGYWRDTLHYEKYLRKCIFLPYLNNEKEHTHSQRYKENICSLENMVLVESTLEDIIEPKNSCSFGSYKIGSASELETVFESDLFKEEDPLGLRRLHETGRLHFRTAYCRHGDFQEDEQNFVHNTLEFLLPADSAAAA